MSDRAGNQHGEQPAPGRVGPEWGLDADRALTRLEDVLLAAPFDRALPDLQELLDAAGVPRQLLERDDRVLKVLHEAIVARPFGERAGIRRVRAEVELLTLEVEVLTDRLLAGADRDTGRRVSRRLDDVRTRLDEIRNEL